MQVDKVLQLHLACSQRIGVIIVGPSGSGKSTTWRLLQAALSSLGRPPILHVVNPKAVSRHHLLGKGCMLTVQLLHNTLEHQHSTVVLGKPKLVKHCPCDMKSCPNIRALHV